jgi:hypothetical protein
MLICNLAMFLMAPVSDRVGGIKCLKYFWGAVGTRLFELLLLSEVQKRIENKSNGKL